MSGRMRRAAGVVVLLLAAAVVAGCDPTVAPAVSEVESLGSPSLAAPLAREEAIQIARNARDDFDVLPPGLPVELAKLDAYGPYADEYALRVSPRPDDSREVWVIVFSDSSGQGANIVVDALDGTVIQAYTFIR